MNLARLRAFVTVAEELHFGRAADRLNMAQPPLSQQIKALEQEVGSTLFRRTTRRVELTPAGATLLPEARKLLRDADAVERLMSEHRSGHAGVLRVGFVDSASYAIMPQFLRSYRRRWPGVNYELSTMSSETQRAALAEGRIDVGIARTRGTEPGLSHTPILEERLVLAVSSEHPLAGRRSVALRDLASESFIGFTERDSPALSVELAAMLGNAGVSYSPILEADEYTTIIGLVAAGEGVALVPETVRSFQPPSLTYVPVRDRQATTRLMLLAREGNKLEVVRHAVALATDLFGKAERDETDVS